jgi:SIR2-like domain/TIR domain
LIVFINYRREDSSGDARLLYERLRAHFGEDNVFFDVKLEPGVDWLREIKSSGARGGAFLAVIGPRWVASLGGRRAAAVSLPVDDFVRREIEWALRDWPGFVIPVLVGATMPQAVTLPRSIRGLCDRQAAELRHTSFDRDVADLINRLERIASEGSDAGDPAEPRLDGGSGRTQVSLPGSALRIASGVPAPNDDHYADVIDGIVQGTVVPVLGSCVRGSLPDADELAAYIAETFNLERGSRDLAEIAQYVAVTRGERRLYTAMKDVFASESEPTDVHLSLAAFPGLLRKMSLPEHPQMIISASYDRALEKAFEDANEPFDYAVYIASAGWFVHFPWGEQDAEPIAAIIKEPQKYADFPIDDDGELERTLIVKIHGATDGQEGTFKWMNAYVVTEDQYIDYLPTQNVQDHLPIQILDKLTGSRCLFLGYVLRDWSARVFLRRIWMGKPISENSWAVEMAPDLLEKASWSLVGHVELLAASLPDYVNTLRSMLVDHSGTR